MKRFYSIAISLVVAAMFAPAAFSQGAAQPAGNLRVVVIDTDAFAATEGGITRYLNAARTLENEFKPLQTELQGLFTKYQTLGAEIKKLQDTVAAGGQVPISTDAIRAKVEEYQALETTIKRKEEDAKARAGRREQQVLGPIMLDIGKAIQEFATQKGYDLVLDIAKLANADLILAINPAKADVTKEFITFFNQRPATAATAAAPR